MSKSTRDKVHFAPYQSIIRSIALLCETSYMKKLDARSAQTMASSFHNESVKFLKNENTQFYDYHFGRRNTGKSF